MQVQSMQSQIAVGFSRGLRPQDEDGVSVVRDQEYTWLILVACLQFPLVHRSEVTLEGMVPMGGGWWANLAEASVNGRSVLVKRYDGKDAKKVRGTSEQAQCTAHDLICVLEA